MSLADGTGDLAHFQPKCQKWSRKLSRNSGTMAADTAIRTTRATRTMRKGRAKVLSENSLVADAAADMAGYAMASSLPLSPARQSTALLVDNAPALVVVM